MEIPRFPQRPDVVGRLTRSLAALCLLAAAPLAAQPEAAAEAAGDEGWHVVRSGETLQQITGFYLGDTQRWRENWRLNPDLADPHRIYPGDRLRVKLPPKLPERTARLAMTSRRVEDQLRPRPWAEAWEDDLLQPNDAVRTFERSSAQLLFGDDTELVLTEKSLVFLWRGEESAPRPVERQLIEIVEGQADLEARPVPGAGGGIEIVLGEATARPRPGPAGNVETRVRRAGGGAQLMVYGGESELEAAGESLEVGEGMGSTVAAGAAPSPPEKLLPAPVTEQPAAGSTWPRAEVELRWREVEGARSYTVEVCLDPDCGRLVERQVELLDTRWRAPELPLGTLFWRATAVSASGLDGYPSEPLSFTASDAPLDREPPRAELRFVGPRCRSGELTVIGPESGLAIDTEPGAQQTLLIDGLETDAARFPEGLAGGEHSAEAVVVDAAGNVTRIEPIRFFHDVEPPVIVWGRDGGEAEGSAAGLEAAAAPASPAATGGAPAADLLQWSTGDSPFFPLGYRNWRYFADKPWLMVFGLGSWRLGPYGQIVAFEQPRFRLRTKKRPVRLGSASLEGGEELWLEAREETCRVRSLRFRASGRDGGPEVLTVEAIDSVGNRTRLVWPLLAGER